MPSIAQQDYIYITIGDVKNLTDAEQLEIGRTIDNGTVYDVIIKSGDNSYRIIALDWGNQCVLVPNTTDNQDSPYIALNFMLPSENE